MDADDESSDVQRRRSSWRWLLAALLLLALGQPLVSRAAAPTKPACTPTLTGRGCTIARSVTAGVSAECRRIGLPADRCAADGRTVSEAEVAAYEASWTHRALALQRRLDADAPFRDELLGHTHNSFNSSSYDPTLTNQDPNQVYGLTDQLRMDVRAIELDLHWVPSIHGTPATGGKWVTLCHGNSQKIGNTVIHVGCSVDRPVEDGLAEIGTWLRANPHEFLLLYLENQLDGNLQAHDIAAAAVRNALGDLVYPTPAGKPCADFPIDMSRAEVMATGARVMIVGNCGPGAWGGLVHERGPRWDESGDPTKYGPSQCASDRAAHDAGRSFRRIYEDSTVVSAVAGGTDNVHVDPAHTAGMVRCGVNIVGFDQLTPDDGRLSALVWSWAPDEPSLAGGCAAQGPDARWRSRPCGDAKPVACLGPANTWQLGPTVPHALAGSACPPGTTFSAPVNGLRNQQLRSAAGTVPEVWVAAPTA